MRPGRGPRRYVCGGVMLSFDTMIDTLERGSGRHIRRIPLRPEVFRAIGRIADICGRVAPLGDGLSYEAAALLTAAIPTDDERTLSDLGLSGWRCPQEAILASLRR